MTTTTATTPTVHSIAPAADIEDRRSRLLRHTLRLNALTSTIGGLAAATAATRVDRVLGADAPGWVRVVGIGLLVFAIDVAAVSMLRTRRVAALAPWVSAVDFAWVAASVVAIALGRFSVAGAVVIAAVAVAVAAFGVEQIVLSRQGARSATR